jgi:hypothetical protein
MAVLPTYTDRHRWSGDAIVSIFGLLLLGTGLGLLTGLALVRVLSLLGMSLDTGTGDILRQVLSW